LIAEEVKDFSQLEHQPIIEETFVETKVVSNKAGFPGEEDGLHETTTTTITETSKKISTSSEHDVHITDDIRRKSSSSSSSDDGKEGVRSKVIEHYHEEETLEANEQVAEECEEDMEHRIKVSMTSSTPPSSPVVVHSEKPHADTSLAEAAVLAQHEQQHREEEKHDEEKRSRKSSTSSAASHGSTSSNSSFTGYFVDDAFDDVEP
jgi:hypothetical protein